MIWLVLFVGLVSQGVTAESPWVEVKGDTVYEFVNADLELSPIFGLEAPPTILLSKDFRTSAALIDVLAATVPRDAELVRLLQFAEADFQRTAQAATLDSALQELDAPTNNLSPAQKRAWLATNKNRNQPLILQLKMHRAYRPLDFEAITYEGENGDFRTSCVAGYAQRYTMEIAGVEFTGDPSLTRQAQAVVGTVFSLNLGKFYGPTKKFFPVVKDRNGMAAACKAEKAKL